MIKSALLVGLGGFLGSILRWALSVWMLQLTNLSFPWGTLGVNLGGSFLIGIFFGLSSYNSILLPDWRLFLATGFCGSFTTFSTFSIENIQLMQQGQYAVALSYTGISLIAGFSLAGLGLFLARTLTGS
jgi:CrcB protein